MRYLFVGLVVLAGFAFSGPASADELDVPIYEYGGDGLPSCATSVVAGLKADGDGFLAVRSEPGSNYRELGRLRNGDKVFAFDRKGKWFGVAFGGSEPGCNSPQKKRLLPYGGRKGWVHGNCLSDLAGRGMPAGR
jgi:hypothetical protein